MSDTSGNRSPAPAVHGQPQGPGIIRTVDWFSDDFDPSDRVDGGSDEFFETLPPGYRFCPDDNELIVCYLRRKVFEKPLPFNRIVDVNIYQYNPEELAVKFKRFGEKEWYFFTSRDRKYPNGKRPKRAAGDGYWKATGADRKIYHEGKLVGYRKTLVFYKGKAQCGDKTNWIMHEYRVEGPPCERKGPTDMTLDKYILSRIYKKTEGVRARLRAEDHAATKLENEDEVLEGDDVLETLSYEEEPVSVTPISTYNNTYSELNKKYSSVHETHTTTEHAPPMLPSGNDNYNGDFPLYQSCGELGLLPLTTYNDYSIDHNRKYSSVHETFGYPDYMSPLIPNVSIGLPRYPSRYFNQFNANSNPNMIGFNQGMNLVNNGANTMGIPNQRHVGSQENQNFPQVQEWIESIKSEDKNHVPNFEEAFTYLRRKGL